MRRTSPIDSSSDEDDLEENTSSSDDEDISDGKGGGVTSTGCGFDDEVEDYIGGSDHGDDDRDEDADEDAGEDGFDHDGKCGGMEMVKVMETTGM